jgi:hypothetical protein
MKVFVKKLHNSWHSLKIFGSVGGWRTTRLAGKLLNPSEASYEDLVTFKHKH